MVKKNEKKQSKTTMIAKRNTERGNSVEEGSRSDRRNCHEGENVLRRSTSNIRSMKGKKNEIVEMIRQQTSVT